MVRLAKNFIISVGLILFSTMIFANASRIFTSSIAGYWQTIDGKTHKPSSIIQIEPKNGVYIGTIVKTYPRDFKNAEHVMPVNEKNEQKSVLGLVIIKDMLCNNTFCHHGTILDPRDGKIYHATMKLIKDGEKLKVRGYIGLPLFGKTVVWLRVKNLNA